ncbi:NACHT domain-containing protein [Streptomyces sp. NPDC015350]|uniref:NACHT domain-containing protein n=1 Tax=Streptomyces sp. NPDC015350 TaxID=3364955 RepID=UPI0036FFC51C
MNPERLALVRAGRTPVPPAQGSGYLIGDHVVLTALHVVTDAAGGWLPHVTVRVGHPRFGPGPVERSAQVCWPDPRDGEVGDDAPDVALLWLQEPVRVGDGPVRWGRPAGTLPVGFEGAGFPLFASDGDIPQFEYVRGRLSVVGTTLRGRWVLDTPVWPDGCGGSGRPWAGASGSAVFCGGRLVGVVVEDDRGMGWRRLYAEPVHPLVHDADFADLLERFCGQDPLPVVEEVRGGRAVPRSGYLREVAQWAAVDAFEGREDELAAMTAFVTAPAGAPEPHRGYWRWLAEAWSGKTTLLARFALNLPTGVDPLAFFITQRSAGQSDRTAFLAAMQRQLREYLHDKDVECTEPGQFLETLERAAQQAQTAGRRLVLIVDGLDEDTGVTSASSAYSITALLPRTLPPGVRVIVAGRPNPRLPSDVHTEHPLRNETVNHALLPSPAAHAAQERAEADLEKLIGQGGLTRDLVGLTAAASGGLAAADLAALTGSSTRMVELYLGGATGRSFQHRPAQWALNDDGLPVELYSFAHQALLEGARDILKHQMDAYRGRIHDWADAWRRTGWPVSTPEYLLLGYPQALRQLGDTTRLTNLATDATRHERIWQTTGTDTEALAEIADAFRLHAPDPDIPACLLLNHRRHELEQAIGNTPDDLIITWAHLGHVRRALSLLQAKPRHSAPELLAQIYTIAQTKPETASFVTETVRGITEPNIRAQALVSVAEALAKAGQYEDAAVLVGEAATAARSITHPDTRARALVSVAEALVGAGRSGDAADLADEAATAAARGIRGFEARSDALSSVAEVLARAGRYEDATATARDIIDFDIRARALSSVAEVLARAGRYEDAATIAQNITNPDDRAQALASVAGALVGAGRYEDAADLADEAATAARSITEPNFRAQALASVAEALAKAGQYEDAAVLVGEAATAARSITHPDTRARALVFVAEALVGAGKSGEAADLADEAARDMPAPYARARAHTLLSVAEVLVGAGRYEDAAIIAQDITSPDDRAQALASVAGALAGAGRYEDAAIIARAAPDPNGRARALASMAKSLAGTGQDGDAVILADEAAANARSITEPYDRFYALSSVAKALARMGRYEDAAATARSITYPDTRARTLASVAEALVGAGRGGEAAVLADEAAVIAHADTLASVAGVLVGAGRYEDAAATARSITEPNFRAQALASVAEALAGVGRYEEAAATARSITYPDTRAWALASVAEALAGVGRYEEAAATARSITYPDTRAWALASVAEALAGAGRGGEAAVLADEAAVIARDIANSDDRAEVLSGAGRGNNAAVIAPDIIGLGPDDCARALSSVAGVLAGVGRYEDAAATARSITHPDTRVRAMAGVGRYEEAAATARSITHPDTRAWALASVAGVLAGVGRYEEAAATARSITYPEEIRARALASVAGVLAGVGRYEEAAATARSITYPEEIRARALASVAEALVGAGRGGEAAVLADEAAVIARDIANSDDRARTLASVAKSLAAEHQCGPDTSSGQTTASPVGHPNAAMAQGRTFLADALNSPVWGPDIADAVLSVEPDCTTAILTGAVPGWHERDYTGAGSTPTRRSREERC